MCSTPKSLPASPDTHSLANKQSKLSQEETAENQAGLLVAELATGLSTSVPEPSRVTNTREGAIAALQMDSVSVSFQTVLLGLVGHGSWARPRPCQHVPCHSAFVALVALRPSAALSKMAIHVHDARMGHTKSLRPKAV